MRARAIALAALLAACGEPGGIVEPPARSIDDQLRQSLAQWGVVPIRPAAERDPALVGLGRALFFDPELSGNRDVSCATCHHPVTHGGDRRTLAIGTGATGHGAMREPDPDRGFLSRNAPSLLNLAIGAPYLFWDGRVADEGRIATPVGAALPPEINSLLVAQAMLPVINREEMRGRHGDVDGFGRPNELALLKDDAYAEVWRAVMRRLLSIDGYIAMFRQAFPEVPPAHLHFRHAATAIAAFEIDAYTRLDSPFDRYLARNDAALTPVEKRGALLFFGKARCANCHSGPLLGGARFANTGVPQLGPGFGSAAPLDIGRGEHVISEHYRFAFRAPPLRNVELTAPYMHNGAYATLESVVRHYDDVEKALREYDRSQIDRRLSATVRLDEATVGQLLHTLDWSLRAPLHLTEGEQAELIAFLGSLTDPSARDLARLVPTAVPSGLPVQE